MGIGIGIDKVWGPAGSWLHGVSPGTTHPCSMGYGKWELDIGLGHYTYNKSWNSKESYFYSWIDFQAEIQILLMEIQISIEVNRNRRK